MIAKHLLKKQARFIKQNIYLRKPKKAATALNYSVPKMQHIQHFDHDNPLRTK